MYNYAKAFITNRTASIHLRTRQSSTFPTPAKGAPQGSVISPLLFSIMLFGLPKLLAEIPGLHHAFYMDDLTVWINRGSAGHQQDSLQQANDTTMVYLATHVCTSKVLTSHSPSPHSRPPPTTHTGFASYYSRHPCTCTSSLDSRNTGRALSG